MTRDLSEPSLIKGIKNKENWAFQHVATVMRPKLKGYVARKSGYTQVSKADDLLQETLIRFWGQIRKDRYQSQGNWQGFFMGIAVNCWREELRRQGKDPDTIDPDNAHHQLSSEPDEEERLQKILMEDKYTRLYKAFDQLKAECRELIRDFHLKGKAQKELAELWEISHSAIRKRLHDCRKRLKKLAMEK